MGRGQYHKRGELIDGYQAHKHPLYHTWASMLSRCFNENDHNFCRYGARGVSVCDSWLQFKNFVCDMGAKPSPELTLERLDNGGGYEPKNCRWDTKSNQCVNRRRFKNNTSGHTGVVHSGGSWVARFDYENVRYNIAWCETFEEAVTRREAFVTIFLIDKVAAILTLPKDKARYTSKTGLRGVSRHADGGFTTRATLNGERHYIGYFKTIEEASNARQEFIASKVG